MNKFEQLTDEELSTFTGGKGGGGKVFGWFYTLLGDADDIKAGFKDGINYGMKH